jgi:putative RNA 2'-phosphotransferase
MNKNLLDESSKFLSYVLRHAPQSIGLKLDREGWANIASLLEKAEQTGKILNKGLIQAIVDGSDKNRFSISDNGLYIRAAQGHSTDSVCLKHGEKEPPDFLYHGTATRFLESIRQQGLVPGSRHHVHLSQDIPTAIAVGRRYGKPVVLRIEALRMHQQGFIFFQSRNEVWLTAHVPCKFLIATDQEIRTSSVRKTDSAST